MPSDSTIRSGVASSPREQSPPASGYRSSRREARKNAGAYTQSTAWSAVARQVHSTVPAGTDQSSSPADVHALLTNR